MKIEIKHRWNGNILYGCEVYDDAEHPLRECVVRAVRDRANLGGANLGGAYLGGANLDGANLGGAKNVPASAREAAKNQRKSWRPVDYTGMQVEAITCRHAIEAAQERLFDLDREQEALDGDKFVPALTEEQATRAAVLAKEGRSAPAIIGILRWEAERAAKAAKAQP
mgnify:CR=1 FL=1